MDRARADAIFPIPPLSNIQYANGERAAPIGTKVFQFFAKYPGDEVLREREFLLLLSTVDIKADVLWPAEPNRCNAEKCGHAGVIGVRTYSGTVNYFATTDKRIVVDGLKNAELTDRLGLIFPAFSTNHVQRTQKNMPKAVVQHLMKSGSL